MRRIEVRAALSFVAIPLAFLIGVAGYQLAVAVPQAQDSRASVAASFRILSAASAVDHAMQDAERGQRGFLLAGRDGYLAPYVAAKAQLPGLMTELQSAMQNLDGQQPRLLALQADITTKMNELESTIAAYRGAGFAAARAIVNTDVGLHSMEDIGAELTAIVDAAHGALAARQAVAAEAERRVTAVFLAGSLISGVGLVSGALLLAYAYRRAADSERTLEATLDSVREGVAAFDANGHLRIWNTPFATLLDLPAAILLQNAPIPTDSQVSPGAPDLVRRIRELDLAAQRSGRPALVSYRSPQGKTLELFHNRVSDGYVTTVLDVSEQRQAEEALRQAQKLEALGQMTGGVAHDFNNLLTIIVGSIAFLRRFVSADAKASQRLDMVAIAAERGARLTRQLLAFARRQPLEPEVVSLDQIMHEILPLLRRALGEDINVEYVAAGGLWNTMIDPAQFQSAALNLAINSRDAMPKGGKLTVELTNAALDDRYAAQHAEVEPGQYVLFAISDTGTGMDQATMARALEPFFTTKAVGDGTGLGLPQVYGFVKQSGGHLKLYSEVGQGTTVKLYLPRSLQDAAQSLPQQTMLAVTGTETILLVDDDEIVRATVAGMLEELGYTVLVAGTGAQALALLEQSDVDLLFTDVVMAGMGGRQLAERALALKASLKVLFTSGYTENAIVHNGRLDPGVELLSKPFDRDKLAAKVRKLLDTATSRTRKEMGSDHP